MQNLMIYTLSNWKNQTPVWGPILKDVEGNSYILLGRKYRNFYTAEIRLFNTLYS